MFLIKRKCSKLSCVLNFLSEKSEFVKLKTEVRGIIIFRVAISSDLLKFEISPQISSNLLKKCIFKKTSSNLLKFKK